MQTKGLTLRTTLEFIRRELGPDAAGRVLEELPADQREIATRSAPTDEVPYRLLLDLWRAADRVLGRERPDWIERSGAFSIESAGARQYAGLLRKESPREFLTQRISLFRLYYQPGNIAVVEEEPCRAVLRLLGFEPGDPLFCRRQTGGLQRAVELAGGASPRVTHVRCTFEQDAFCEWELSWGPEPAAT